MRGEAMRSETEDISPVSHYRRVRATTLALVEPLSAEDCCAQSMPDASPAKWHLAHTAWFFETFVLEQFEPQFAAFDPAFRVLFNSYYDGVGARHPRPQRGLLTRPDLETVLRYRAQVDQRMGHLLGESDDARLLALVELGLQHEQQHQELILTDIKHLLSCNPLWPAYRQQVSAQRPVPQRPERQQWFAHPGGLVQIGHAGEGFSFDNERPRHSVYLEPFELARTLVSNAQYLAFIDDGGYANPALWLAAGWDWRNAENAEAPLYWRRTPEGWQEFTLQGAQALAADAPVAHLSYFEADAFARWAGARLPTEAEWEAAAHAMPMNLQFGNFADSAQLHPVPQPSAEPTLFGNLWQWTRSGYDAYPGFVQEEGAVGEYNGKFMVNQYVLRGGSCATPADHIRASYRNFFPATTRWQFSGLRLARG